MSNLKTYRTRAEAWCDITALAENDDIYPVIVIHQGVCNWLFTFTTTLDETEVKDLILQVPDGHVMHRELKESSISL